MIVDALVYLALSAVAFGLTIVLWRAVFADFRNWLDRFLFWGTVVGVAFMFVGWWHVFTGERPFGFVLMMLALVEATVVMVAVNAFAHRAYNQPYDPAQDPEFMAEVAARRRRIEAHQQQCLPNDRSLLR